MGKNDQIMQKIYSLSTYPFYPEKKLEFFFFNIFHTKSGKILFKNDINIYVIISKIRQPL